MKSHPMKVVIASSGHEVNDDMIYHRYAELIGRHGYSVVVLGKPSRVESCDYANVSTGTLNTWEGRLARFTKSHRSLIDYCRFYEPDLLIVAGPDLIPAALWLKDKCPDMRMVYLAVENYSDKIMGRSWIPTPFRPVVRSIICRLEDEAARRLDCVITTDSHAASRIDGSNCVVIPNYPNTRSVDINQLAGQDTRDAMNTVFRAVYIGSISKERGLQTMAESASLLPSGFEIHLYGSLADGSRDVLLSQPRLQYCGSLQWPDVLYAASKYDAGICIFQSGCGYDHIGENTTKLFEYMLCGLPIVCSNQPGLVSIVERSKCGICVDSGQPRHVADSLIWLSHNKTRASEMGALGRDAVLLEYNWDSAGAKLMEVIDRLAGQ